MKKIISYIKKRIKRLYCKHDKVINTGHYMDTDERGHQIKKYIWKCKECDYELWGGKKCKRPE